MKKDARDDIPDQVPEHPSYLKRRVQDGPYVAYARVGDTVFRGESNANYARAVEDLDARVITWRLARDKKNKEGKP